MVINNWMVTVQMYVDVIDNTYVRIYFIAFYYLSVVIALNVVVAFTLDMYASVERIVNNRDEAVTDLIREQLADISFELKDFGSDRKSYVKQVTNHFVKQNTNHFDMERANSIR